MSDEPRLLGGRYQLGSLLGRGGMAEVRRARDLRLGRDVAVKQLRIDLATDSTFQARFRREAQAAAGLNHPNIVAVYDTGEEADPNTGVQVPFIVMELVNGHTLREILRTGRQIQPEKALEFAQGVLDALSYSHKAGIVHRDIKPANVMLTPNGQIKVMDFGIARAVADTSATMTQTAAVIGTAQYLSPEQARGETVDSRSDIYSAGCLLYELLVGRPPFQGDSPVSVAYQHVREAPVPPSQLDPMISPGMDTIVLKSLAKDPADRYQTAAAMRADIGRLLAGQDVVARVPRPTAAFPVGANEPTIVAAAPTSVLSADTGTQTGTATRALEPTRQRNLTPLWATLISLAVIAAAVGVFLLLNPMGQPTMVKVPSLTGMTAARATEELEQLELVPKSFEVEGKDDGTIGQVINQRTQAETPVPVGTVIEFEVNIGPVKKTIPTGLMGQPYEDVVQILEDLNFTVNVDVDPNEPLTAVADEVTYLNPAEGASIELSKPITVLYATGESPVPNFRGLDEESAADEAERNGFQVSFKTEPSEETEGTVISQKPGVGQVVPRTTRIKLVLAGPMPVTDGVVPNFRGLDQASATEAARVAGFLDVSFSSEPSAEAEGTVISQKPAAGQKAPLTTQIRLVLAEPLPEEPPPEETPGEGE
ncbi:MAG: Stk1 family PASTA domain-containing Ser/Thr kinase [Actinobacteria bacterium]|nr:Stk1 family PASTA domain-containing Ser/Thr kinase [Actinomycetota bacterium]